MSAACTRLNALRASGGRLVGAVGALTLALVLSGCAMFSLPATGTPAAQVPAQMGGAPMAIQPLANGGERWLYSTLPMGREVYHVDLDAARRVTSVMQVLDFQHLSTTPIGWTRNQVLDFYGPPYEITEVASFRGKVWTYRFNDAINLRRMAHIHIGVDSRVAKVMFTDEPTAEDFRMR